MFVLFLLVVRLPSDASEGKKNLVCEESPFWWFLSVSTTEEIGEWDGVGKKKEDENLLVEVDDDGG